jgi:cytochrome c-type biogenesis protein CcsB
MFYDYQLPVIACFFFFGAMIFYWLSLAFPKKIFMFSVGKTLALGGNFFLMITLLSRWIKEGYFPLSNLYESLLFLSWGISTLHFLIESQTKSRLIGSISTPLLFFLSGFSSFTLPIEMQKALPLVPSLQSNWLMMHVSMMMVSYATLIIGSLLSILYLFFFQFLAKKSTISLPLEDPENANQLLFSENKMDSRSIGVVGNSNPFSRLSLIEEKASTLSKVSANESIQNSDSKLSLLQTIDIWSYRIIGLGFPFLTIGIISGAVWANEAWGSYWSWDPKETWALITWLVFAIYLHSRLLKGWQGEKAAFLGTCGFFVIWICYLGVNFLGKGLHSYGWVL